MVLFRVNLLHLICVFLVTSALCSRMSYTQMLHHRVNHHLLFRKLASIGFTNNVVAFMDSYLSRRVYSVRVGKEYSEKYYATSGVPQGSNIAPLLF